MNADSRRNEADTRNADEPDSDPLIEQIRNRDVEALGRYLDQYRDALARFVRSITGEHLLAVIEVDDLVQEIATTAVASLPTAPLQDHTVMQWLQHLARRRVVDAHRFHFDAKRRDAGRQQSLHGGGQSGGNSDGLGLEQMLAASMTSPSAVVSNDIRLSAMAQAIGRLNDEQQTAIRLRYVEGLPTKAIAENLGKTDVAVRVLLSRSMRQLEKELEDVRPTR
ncbi:RNA polymerase sigma-70 factor, ECF subfamily [Neorhodopirellula lusitana]|uniref:RNA polymerase sigma-70 factor, ECF subfamily n=1 Tax=Neorhodopirellula lusitana TaxID=445327 RepID=A0ABY1PTG0_9BACT|nr:sigma-70 family RNA polymerase sigma factor [Neorhodopirellula lusitana]SMP46995.1 RNA polymerase sigma-70 factor, ECF subfamily [Neorhodopirellula lusitana]